MANYYTQICFELPCTAAEQALVIAAINCEQADLRTDVRLKLTLEFLSKHFDAKDVDEFSIGAKAEAEGDAVSIFGDECPDIDAIAGIIQHLAPSALPFGFTYAESCSRPKFGAYSGGWVLVTADGCRMVGADESLREAMAAARAQGETRAVA